MAFLGVIVCMVSNMNLPSKKDFLTLIDIIREWQAMSLSRDHHLTNVHIFRDDVSKSFNDQVLSTCVLRTTCQCEADHLSDHFERRKSTCLSSSMTRMSSSFNWLELSLTSPDQTSWAEHIQSRASSSSTIPGWYALVSLLSTSPLTYKG